MKVLISKLYRDYDYSNEAEEFLGKLIGNKFGLGYCNPTKGYNPEYDFMLGNKKIEVKFTSNCYPTIEFARADLRPSGLLLSQADYYLTISPGGSKGKFVGKIRLYKRVDLLEKFIQTINSPLTSNFKSYAPSDNSPGSICFELNPQNINDIWIGDCDLIFSSTDTKKVIGFDLGTVKFTRKSLII